MIDAAVRRQMRLRGCKDCRYFLRSLKQCSRGMENCILFSKNMAAGKPDCGQCYWWDEKRGCCRRGRAGCAYDLAVRKQKEKENNEEMEADVSCDGCPYRTGRPCVGYCIRQILHDWKRVRSAVGKAGDAVK